MRKKKSDPSLFGGSIPPSCAYCDHNLSPSCPTACRFGLKLSESGQCKRYRYNPLLRQPHAAPALPNYDPEEFKL